MVYHYCVSSILQRIKTVNKIWWYKQLFFKLCYWVKYNLKPKMYIVVIWLSSYASFFFLFIFKCFILSVFFFSLMFSALNPITKKTMILSKYHWNMTLMRAYKRAVSIGKKNIDFSLCIVALYIKALGPYSTHLGISYCMCNVLKASLFCKFVTNFYVLL